MANVGIGGRRLLIILHLFFVCLWVGGAVALNLMLILLDSPQSGGELLGYDIARKFVDDYIIIPGAVGSLVSGFFISLLTPWGFFKHRWVLVKWILTVGCILFGTFILGPMVNAQPGLSAYLGLEALNDSNYNHNWIYNIYFGLAQCVLILFMVVISVIKPWKKNLKPVKNP